MCPALLRLVLTSFCSPGWRLLCPPLPSPRPGPLGWVCGLWDESGSGGSGGVFGFLFCFAHASRRSPLCLMSRCRVHAVAGRREGSPRVIHGQLPVHLLALCVSLGKGLLPGPRWFRRLRRGNVETRKFSRTLGPLGAFRGPRERECLEGEASSLPRGCLEPQGASVKAAARAFGGADSCLQTLSFRSAPAGTRLEASSPSPRLLWSRPAVSDRQHPSLWLHHSPHIPTPSSQPKPPGRRAPSRQAESQPHRTMGGRGACWPPAPRALHARPSDAEALPASGSASVASLLWPTGVERACLASVCLLSISPHVVLVNEPICR